MCIRNNQRQTEAHKIILEDIFLLSVGIRTRDNKRKYNREINEVLDLLMYEYTKYLHTESIRKFKAIEI